MSRAGTEEPDLKARERERETKNLIFAPQGNVTRGRSCCPALFCVAVVVRGEAMRRGKETDGKVEKK